MVTSKILFVAFSKYIIHFITLCYIAKIFHLFILWIQLKTRFYYSKISCWQSMEHINLFYLTIFIIFSGLKFFVKHFTAEIMHPYNLCSKIHIIVWVINENMRLIAFKWWRCMFCRKNKLPIITSNCNIFFKIFIYQTLRIEFLHSHIYWNTFSFIQRQWKFL